MDPKELALQIVDIVALRPEVELCYMGIANKCFEILENRRNSSESGDGRPESHLGLNGGSLEEEEAGAGSEGDEEEDEDEEGEEEVAEEEDADDPEVDTESDDDDDEEEGDSESEGHSSEAGRGMARLRLREILFYDDKVAIFKARHGKL